MFFHNVRTPNAYRLLFLFLAFGIASHANADYLLDDFSTGIITANKWNNAEYETIIDSGELTLRMEYANADESYARHRLRLSGDIGEPEALSAMIKINSASNADNGLSSFGRVASIFYNAGASTPVSGDLTDDVWVAVFIGDRGNGGIESWWIIEKSSDSSFGSSEATEGTLIGPGTLTTETYYTVSIVYNSGADTFTFSIKEGKSGTPTDHELTSPYPQLNSSENVGPRLDIGFNYEDGGTGEESTIDASFDDVSFEGSSSTIGDDFSSTNNFSDRWNIEYFPESATIDIENEQLIIDTSANGETRTYRTRMNLADEQTQCLKADISYLGASSHPDTTRGRVRLAGYWYNDTSDTYTGVDRIVWASIQVERREGQLRASAGGWIEDSTLLPDEGEELFWHVFSTPVSEDTFYSAFIELDETNKKLIFGFNGELYTHNITTPIYPIPNDSFRQLRTELRGETSDDKASGYISSAFDNVRIGVACNTVGGDTISIDPKGSFLTPPDPTDEANEPTKVLLSTLNISPGDMIEIKVLGAYDKANSDGPEDYHQQLIGVFVDDTDQKIAPGNASTVSGIVSDNAQPSNESTDIPEDFEIAPLPLEVEVPQGAHALWLTPNDSFFADNIDPNSDYELHILNTGNSFCFPIKTQTGAAAIICL